MTDGSAREQHGPRTDSPVMRPSTDSLALAKWGDRLHTLVAADVVPALLMRRVESLVEDTRNHGVTRATMRAMLEETLFRASDLSPRDAKMRTDRLRACTHVALEHYEVRRSKTDDDSASAAGFRLGEIARSNPNFAPFEGRRDGGGP